MKRDAGAGCGHCAGIRRGNDDRHDPFERGAGSPTPEDPVPLWHRGMREMDLIMGRFADDTVTQLTQEELAHFEQLMEVPDRELLAWVTGEAVVSAEHDTPLFRRNARLQPSPRADGNRYGAQSCGTSGPGRPLTLAGVADGAEGLIVSDLARAVAARPGAPATVLVVVCRDGPRVAALARALDFFAPDLVVEQFPAWDCLPYDRVSPHAGFVAQRMTALSRLVRVKGAVAPRSCSPQSTPFFSACRDEISSPGNRFRSRPATCWRWTALPAGLNSTASCARRQCASLASTLCVAASSTSTRRAWQSRCGSIFGDTLETIRSFDPESQRTTDQLRALDRTGSRIPTHD